MTTLPRTRVTYHGLDDSAYGLGGRVDSWASYGSGIILRVWMDDGRYVNAPLEFWDNE